MAPSRTPLLAINDDTRRQPSHLVIDLRGHILVALKGFPKFLIDAVLSGEVHDRNDWRPFWIQCKSFQFVLCCK